MSKQFKSESYISPFINKKTDIQSYIQSDMLNKGTNSEHDTEVLKHQLKWLCTTPQFTTFRINTLVTTAREVCEIFKRHFEKEIMKHGRSVGIPEVFVHPVLQDTVVIKNLTENELDELKKQIIVDAACGAAVLRGSNVYAPGVMGMPAGICCGDTVSVYADRLGKCKKGLIKPFLEESRVFLGNGIVHMERKDLYGKDSKPSGVAIQMISTSSGCPPIGDDCLPSNLALLQNLPSILCCYVLNPQKNETILDMCAAPGNKTSHIAMLMKDKGIIIALDKSESKVNSILKRCQQFSLQSVHPFVCDATKILESVEIQKKFASVFGGSFSLESFDRILLDAPCSALGQRPQLANKITVNQLKSYPLLQRKLFHSAVSLLKPGGVLVYSTCTLTMAENEGIVHWALKHFPCLELEPSLPRLGGPGLENSDLSEDQKLYVQRFGPPLISNDCDHDTVGFFIACFYKKITNVNR